MPILSPLPPPYLLPSYYPRSGRRKADLRTDLAEQPAHSLLALNSSLPSHPSTRYLSSGRPFRATRALTPGYRLPPPEQSNHLSYGNEPLSCRNGSFLPRCLSSCSRATNRLYRAIEPLLSLKSSLLSQVKGLTLPRKRSGCPMTTKRLYDGSGALLPY